MPKKPKLSQWHDGSVKPVHVGVYERNWDDPSVNDSYSYFDGKTWKFSDSTIDAAFNGRNYVPSINQSLKWRGIIK